MNIEPYAAKHFSQFEEDGITLELVRRLNPPSNFVEIGAGNGSENCTRVLADKLGWDGLWFDGDPENYKGLAAAADVYEPAVWAYCRFFTRENLRSIFLKTGVPLAPGVLSIDVDGNDYHLWEEACGTSSQSVLAPIRPWIVIIEAQIQRPWDEPWIMEYQADYKWPHNDNDSGASVCSMRELGERLGYAYVGKTPNPDSPNLFFVRADLAGRLG